MESRRDDMKIRQSLVEKGISMMPLNLENTGKDQLKEGPISIPSPAPTLKAVMVAPFAVDTFTLSQTPSTTSSSNSPLAAGLPSMTKTPPTATVSLPNRPTSGSFSLKSTVAAESPATPNIVSFEQRMGKVLLPDDLSSIFREGDHLRKLLFQKLASEAAISPAQLLKMVEKAQRKEPDLELRKGVPDDSLKQRPSSAGLLGESTLKVMEFAADLPRQGEDRSQTAKQLKEAEGKPTKLGEESAKVVGSKGLEMFRIAGDSSNTIIFLDLSSAGGKSLEHTTLTLGGGRILVKVMLLLQIWLISDLNFFSLPLESLQLQMINLLLCSWGNC